MAQLEESIGALRTRCAAQEARADATEAAQHELARQLAERQGVVEAQAAAHSLQVGAAWELGSSCLHCQPQQQ